MATSPIYKLYESQGKDSRVEAESPAKKKRKRSEVDTAYTSGSSLSKELRDVQIFMSKLNKKTEELKTLVKESTKTKTEIKAATRELVDIVGNLNKKVDILKAQHLVALDKAKAHEKCTTGALQGRGTYYAETQTSSSENTSYADLLRSVKDCVDPDRVGVQVKTIRKTREGDLLLEVRGDRQKAGALKEAISKKMENRVSLVSKDITIHVLDIDAALTKEDVEKAIGHSLGNSRSQRTTVRSHQRCEVEGRPTDIGM
ncbi:hypothetical protein QE152_g13525 [Popillia japonica]|uniref:Uncharacterized protein n=1 Tax=Popillia japonica TaxID=7064 RepID=A0AAW1LBS9_POPJA